MNVDDKNFLMRMLGDLSRFDEGNPQISRGDMARLLRLMIRKILDDPATLIPRKQRESIEDEGEELT